MHLKQTRQKSGRTNLSIVESWWDAKATNWWVFDHRTDESDLIVEAVGLEDLKLKNLTTGKAMEILAKAAKGAIPHGK